MEILEDPERMTLEEIVVGCWGESYDNGVQAILDMFVEHKEKFSHIKNLFIGDMDYEECEVSWIEQGDYTKLWDALPKLEKLNLYIGVEAYGFDGDIEDIKNLVANSNFKNLKYLGLGDSEIEDDIVGAVIESSLIEQLEVLDFSNGTLSDKMMSELEKLGITIDLSEQEENDEEYGNYPMLTE